MPFPHLLPDFQTSIILTHYIPFFFFADTLKSVECSGWNRERYVSSGRLQICFPMWRREKVALDSRRAYRAYFAQNKGGLHAEHSACSPFQGWGIHKFFGQREWRKILPEPSLILSLSPDFFRRAQCVALPEWPIGVSHVLSVCFNLMKKVPHWAVPSITSSWKLYILYILQEEQRINNSLVRLLKYLFSNAFYHLFFLDMEVSDENICPALRTFANNSEIYIIITYSFLWWRILKLQAAYTFSAAISVHIDLTNYTLRSIFSLNL